MNCMGATSGDGRIFSQRSHRFIESAGWRILLGMEKGQKKDNSPPQSFLEALKRSSLMFLSITPILLGVIGLVGLMQTYVTPEMLTAFFSGNPMHDTLIGTLAGSAASGNAMMSYIIGGELLGKGISLYAVAAFILSWVTLGFVHLPAEAEILGLRFTIYRNVLAFSGTVLIALATVLTMEVLT